MFVLALAAFRQRLRDHRLHIVVSSAVITLVSAFVQSTHSVFGLAVLQPLFVILCFYTIFRLRFVYALIVSVVIYLVETTSEIAFFVILSQITSEDFFVLAQERVTMPAIFLIVLNSIVSLVLIRHRLGFSFVPFQVNGKKRIQPRFQTTMFFIMSIGLLVIILTVSSIFYWKTETVIIQSFSVVLLIGIIRYFYVKELTDD